MNVADKHDHHYVNLPQHCRLVIGQFIMQLFNIYRSFVCTEVNIYDRVLIRDDLLNRDSLIESNQSISMVIRVDQQDK